MVFYPENYGDPSALDSALSARTRVAGYAELSATRHPFAVRKGHENSPHTASKFNLAKAKAAEARKAEWALWLLACMGAEAPGERERTIIKAAHETWRNAESQRHAVTLEQCFFSLKVVRLDLPLLRPVAAPGKLADEHSGLG